MSPNDLLAIIRKRPFEPFRIHLSDNTTYDILQPELVMPGLSMAVVGELADPAQPFIRVSHTISLRHILKITPLNTPAAAG
jgi:hypothetical protein